MCRDVRDLTSSIVMSSLLQPAARHDACSVCRARSVSRRRASIEIDYTAEARTLQIIHRTLNPHAPTAWASPQSGHGKIMMGAATGGLKIAGGGVCSLLFRPDTRRARTI